MQSIDVRGFLFSPQSKPEISNLMSSFFAGGDPKNGFFFFLTPPPKKFFPIVNNFPAPQIFPNFSKSQTSRPPKFLP